MPMIPMRACRASIFVLSPADISGILSADCILNDDFSIEARFFLRHAAQHNLLHAATFS